MALQLPVQSDARHCAAISGDLSYEGSGAFDEVFAIIILLLLLLIFLV